MILNHFSIYLKDWILYMFDVFGIYLTHFSPVSHFCTPWKRQKTFGFLTFSRGIEMWPLVFWRFQGV